METFTSKDYCAPLCERIEVELENLLCQSGGTEQYGKGDDFSDIFDHA